MLDEVVVLVILVGGAFVIIAWGYMALTWLCRDMVDFYTDLRAWWEKRRMCKLATGRRRDSWR